MVFSLSSHKLSSSCIFSSKVLNDISLILYSSNSRLSFCITKSYSLLSNSSILFLYESTSTVSLITSLSDSVFKSISCLYRLSFSLMVESAFSNFSFNSSTSSAYSLSEHGALLSWFEYVLTTCINSSSSSTISVCLSMFVTWLDNVSDKLTFVFCNSLSELLSLSLCFK